MAGIQFMKHEESPQEKARRNERVTASFNEWMAEPMTRFAMASIPAGDHQDALAMLLRAAFESGVGLGQVETAISLAEGLMNHRRKNGD